MSIYKRPEITEELIDFIRQFIKMNPDKGRTRLSIMLYEIWDWRDSSGRTKDMSCRDMLTSLGKAGKISLPAPRCILRHPGDSKGVKHFMHDETPIKCSLKELQPLQVDVVASVGRTTGRGRNGGHHSAIVPEKDIYLCPLSKDWRVILLRGNNGGAGGEAQ